MRKSRLKKAGDLSQAVLDSEQPWLDPGSREESSHEIMSQDIRTREAS